MKAIHTFTLFSGPYNYMNGQYKYLSDNGIEIHLVCSYDSKAQKFCIDNGIKYHPIEFTRKITPIRDLVSFCKLFSYMCNQKFDVVVGNMTKDSLLLMIAANLLGIKNRIYYRHGLLHTTMKGLKRWCFLMEERLVSRLATRVVNMSPSVSAIAIKDHLNSPDVQIMFNKGTCSGIDAKSYFNPENIKKDVQRNIRNKYSINETDLVYGFCGRFCKDKGLEDLVYGFKKFQENNPDIQSKLLLIGELDTRDAIDNHIVSEIDNCKDIIKTGWVDKSAIRDFYSIIDVFILPSYREGFPTVTLEASSMGLPVLTTRVHGCIDSIVENETGFFVDHAPISIAEGMQKFINEKVRREMGKKGREWVLKNFDHTVVWPEVLKMYNGLK